MRQQQWTPPDLSRRPQRSLSTYSEEGYVLGDSNPSTLKRIANLFTNGANGPNQRKRISERPVEPIEPSAPSELDAGGHYQIPKYEAANYELEATEPPLNKTLPEFPLIFQEPAELDINPVRPKATEDRMDSGFQEFPYAGLVQRRFQHSRVQADEWAQDTKET